MKAYILLDRSSSMATTWSDTLGSINAFVKGLPSETEVYLAAFSGGGWGAIKEDEYRVLRNELVETFNPLSTSEVVANGNTPLLDSMGKMLDIALNESPERAYIVIMTDGEENTSKTFTKEVIKEKLARVEDRDYEVVFLGANFDGIHGQSSGFGLLGTKSINMAVGNYHDTMTNLSATATAYATRGVRTNFTADDVAKAATPKSNTKKN
jgi:hypothetical protein